jgi:hypothetical protein
MNKEIRGLLFEIIFLIFVMIISIPIYNISSKNNLLAREVANGTTKGLDVNILQRGDMETTDDIIKVKNLDNNSAKYDLILVLSKEIDINNVGIILNGKEYSLKTFKYSVDIDNYYFTIDSFNINNKDMYFNFRILNYSVENINISYSVRIERNLYGL